MEQNMFFWMVRTPRLISRIFHALSCSVVVVVVFYIYIYIHLPPAGCGIARVVVQNLIQKCKPSQYSCFFDDVFWGSRILSFLKPNLPKPKRQRKIRRRFCPGLSSTFMRPVSSRLAQFLCTS